MSRLHVTIAHSADLDDYCLFWPLRRGWLPLAEGMRLSFVESDTESLNEAASAAAFDIVAISASAYLYAAKSYAVIPYGASIGRGYGPVLVSLEARARTELAGLRVGIPGRMTSAAALLRLFCPEAETVIVPTMPYERVFCELRAHRIDAAVIIHEGQLSYRDYGLELVADLGRWWSESTSLPLPLGINVIKRSLGAELCSGLCAEIRKSVVYARRHQQQIMDEIAAAYPELVSRLTPELKGRYLDMYANEDSQELKPDAREALQLLLSRLGMSEAIAYGC